MTTHPRQPRLWQRPCVAVAVACLALGIPGMGGCATRNVDSAWSIPVSGDVASAWSAAVAIDVDHVGGPVRIVAGEHEKGIRVRARRVTPTGYETVPSWAAASVTQEGDRWVVRVMTHREADQVEGPVELSIFVHRIGGVRVRNVEGPVSIEGSGGAVEVRTAVAQGGPGGRAVTVRAAEPIAEPMLITTNRGDIEVVAPVGSAGQVEARSAGGGGRAAVVAPGARTADVRVDTGTWTGRLNDGDLPITLLTGAGNITLRVGR